MRARVAGMNKAKLAENQETTQTKPCTCTRAPCPVGGECKQEDVIYKAKTINQTTQEINTYIGRTSNQFIVRHRNHLSSLRNRQYERVSELSKHKWAATYKGDTLHIDWEIMKKSKSYRPGMKTCNLCIEEIMHILFNQTNERESLLNKREELYSKCRHMERWKIGSVKVGMG